jgi:Ala-tRNA(Pro) deacylase
VAKVVIVIAKRKPAMLVIPAHERLCMEAVEDVLRSSVRPATEPELAVLLPDCQVGTMPPFGALYDIPLYVDEDLTRDKTFCFQSGSYTETMTVRYADYARLVQPIVGHLSFCLLSAASGV